MIDEDFSEAMYDYDDGEEEDENGIMEKLSKRYNSLTSLLMKSFRKAKKKKKEQMQQMVSGGGGGGSGGGIELLEKTNFEDRSEYRHLQQPSVMLRSNNQIKIGAKSNDLVKGLISQNAYIARRGSIKSNLSTLTAPAVVQFHQAAIKRDASKGKGEDDDADDPASMPVFIGAKVIFSFHLHSIQIKKTNISFLLKYLV